MNNNPADQYFPRAARASARTSGEFSRRRGSRTKKPSGVGYLITALSAAIVLFFGLWWVLVSGGDEAPWIPAGLAASVVLLIALSAREVVMRRAWTRHLLEQGPHEQHAVRENRKHSNSKRPYSSSGLSAALRTIQKQSAAADANGGTMDSHLDVFNLCREYAASAEEALQASELPAEKRMAIKAGRERVRLLQKHHLLTWARESSRALTAEAQQRARMFDKIESANRAVQCLDSALEVYPNDPELNASKLAIREFIASVQVAHWVELAERSAFKGHYRRAIGRYKDALFYLTRETVNEDVRADGEKRIATEIERLEARLQVRRGRAEERTPGEGGNQ